MDRLHCLRDSTQGIPVLVLVTTYHTSALVLYLISESSFSERGAAKAHKTQF